MIQLAEGTEAPDEIEYLWGRGCDLYQGYYFARPLAPEQFRAGLEQVAAAASAVVDRAAGRPPRRADLALAS